MVMISSLCENFPGSGKNFRLQGFMLSGRQSRHRGTDESEGSFGMTQHATNPWLDLIEDCGIGIVGGILCAGAGPLGWAAAVLLGGTAKCMMNGFSLGNFIKGGVAGVIGNFSKFAGGALGKLGGWLFGRF